MDTLMGLVLVLAGIALVTSGLRVFFFMLPAAGFLTGFFTGALLISGWLGDSFLATAAGWITGLVLGLLFAAASYLWWYAGALLSAGATGALLFSGIATAFGAERDLTLLLTGIIGAAVFILAAHLLALPVWWVLIGTAVTGAYAVIGGLLLLMNREDLPAFRVGHAVAAVNDSWVWWLVLVVLTGLGIFSQLPHVAAAQLLNRRWDRAQTR